MKQFTSVNDIADLENMVGKALEHKAAPIAHVTSGKHKTLGLLFMNPSFRTRLSMQKAAMNLGLQTIVLNINQEGWQLELEDGAIMNGTAVEHIRDAAAIMSLYCDIVGIRCFPGLKSRSADYSEQVLTSFLKHCSCPVISLESATLHPLQSYADLITIREHWQLPTKPKVVLTWAPHIKALPQAVPNSFSEWMCRADVDFVITHPEGYALCPAFTEGAAITTDQQQALAGADFVYAKNWSSYEQYGELVPVAQDWLLTPEKMKLTHRAKILHCMPVRRNIELPDALLDGPDSLILQQAENRVYAAQAVLHTILQTLVNTEL